MRLAWKSILYVYRLIVYGILATISNQLALWSFNVETGKQLRINGFLGIRAERTSKIKLGDKVRINSGPFFNPIGRNQQTRFICYDGASIFIGSNVGLSSTVIVGFKKIIIEDDVRIGGNCVIYDSDFHSLKFEDRIATPEDPEKIALAEVHISRGVFIGAHSTILKGTTIGEFSVIGAGSVVSGNIPPGQIWAGNPARYIKDI